MNLSQSKLPAHEWLIVALLISLIFSMAAIAYRQEGRSLPLSSTAIPHELLSTTIQVSIEGAVANPGSYPLKRGASIQDLLHLASPLPEADLGKINKRSKLYDGQKISIMVRPLITIFVVGAVEEEGPITLMKGSRLEDLIGQARFKPEADLKKVKSKRILKDREVVRIPAQDPMEKGLTKKKRKKSKSACVKMADFDNLAVLAF